MRRVTTPKRNAAPTVKDAGSGTLDVGKVNPLATAKASSAAMSPDDVPPLTPWLKFAANALKSAALTKPS